MSKPIVLFYGYGNEYVFDQLENQVKSLGFPTLGIDVLKEKDAKKKINNLIGKKIIFITSAELLLDKKNFDDVTPIKTQLYSPLEIISLLKPIKSIYIPHDLTEPLIKNEEYFLNNFDYFFSPCEPFTTYYSKFCQSIEIGWIRNTNNWDKVKKINGTKALFLLSNFVLHLKIGVKESLKELEPILKQKVAIKFPTWIGVEKFERYYKKNGISLYPSTLNSVDLIKLYDIILTTGMSSINAESYLLGKTTINIYDESGFDENIKKLKNLLPNIIFVKNISDLKIDRIKKQKRKSVLKPFNIHMAVELITQN